MASTVLCLAALSGGCRDWERYRHAGAGGGVSCDATTGSPGELLWARTFAGAGDARVKAVAAAPDGSVVVVGDFVGALVAGEQSFESVGGAAPDIFLVKIGCGGEMVFAKSFGDDGEDTASGVRVDPQGNIVLAGTSHGTINFGGSQLSGGANGVVVAKFDAAGEHLWSKAFSGGADTQGRDLALSGADRILLTGVIEGQVNFGGGPLSGDDYGNAFVAELEADGGYRWATSWGDSATQLGHGVAADAAGSRSVIGGFEGTLELGTTVLTSQGAPTDIFLARWDADGSLSWALAFESESRFFDEWRVVATADGGVLGAGEVSGDIDFGGGVLPQIGGASYSDVALFMFDAGGAHRWSRRFGDWETDEIGGITVDRNGDVLLAISFQDIVDFGGGALVSADLQDIALARFSADGDHRWSIAFPAAGSQHLGGLALDPDGKGIIAGDFDGELDLGAGPTQSDGGRDGFVAKLRL